MASLISMYMYKLSQCIFMAVYCILCSVIKCIFVTDPYQCAVMVYDWIISNIVWLRLSTKLLSDRCFRKS